MSVFSVGHICHRTYSSSLNWSQSPVSTESCNSHNSLSTLGEYLIVHFIVSFCDNPHSSANCSTSSKNSDNDIDFPSNLGAE